MLFALFALKCLLRPLLFLIIQLLKLYLDSIIVLLVLLLHGWARGVIEPGVVSLGQALFLDKEAQKDLLQFFNLVLAPIVDLELLLSGLSHA